MTTFMETEKAVMPDAFDRVLSDSIQICEVANIYDGQPVEWRGSLDKLARRLTKHTHRDERDGPCFIPVLFNYGRKGGQAEARAMVTLDIELLKALGVIPPPPHAIARQLHNEGLFSTIATSWSHTSELPRYRICLFLSAAIRLDTAEAAALDKWFLIAVVNYLGLQDVCDPMGYRLTQPFYWPACPQASEFYADVIAGEPMGADLVAALMAKAGELKADHDAAEAAEREARARKRPISDRASVIEAFNAAHPISDLLMQYGYTRKGRHYRSPLQTSPSYATRIFPGERSYWVSLSGSDAAEGIGSECKSGGRYGDAFDLFSFFEYSHNFAAAIKAAARELGMKHEKPAGEEWSHAEGVEDFKRGAGEGAETGTEKPVHPLARFVDPLPDTLRQPKMILPGLIAAGLVVIAGQHGVGKTTVLASIVVKVAGATELGDPLAPRYGRHVIYVSEDTAQFQRIMYAVAKAIPGAGAIIRQRVHLVEAVRMPIDQVVKVAAIYTERFTEEVDGNRLPPLVVLDTRSAIIAIDDENDNAETSQIMAALKQRFAGLPVWIVGHVAKASFGRADAKNMSARGATALEGDAHQVIFIVIEDDDQRFLIRGKTRFEAAVASCRLVSHVEQEWGVDEFGAACEIPIRHVTVEPLTAEEEGDRKADAAAAKRQARDDGRAAEAKEAGRQIIDWVILQAEEGNRYDKSGVCERTRHIKGIGNKTQRLALVDQLVEDQELEVIKWPVGERPGARSVGYIQRKDWTAGNMGGAYNKSAEEA